MTDPKQPNNERLISSESSGETHSESETTMSQDPKTGETIVSSSSRSEGHATSRGRFTGTAHGRFTGTSETMPTGTSETAPLPGNQTHTQKEGATASGKSELLKRMIEEAQAAGEDVTIIDPDEASDDEPDK